MAVESHIHSLKKRHHELDVEIEEEMSRLPMSADRISELKRQKLKIKDRIHELSSQEVN